MPFIDIDTDTIRQLADIMRETGLSEVEVSEGEKTVRVARAVFQPAAGAVPTHVVADYASQQVQAPRAAAVADPLPVNGRILSPMVGTVYLQSEPSSPPFVRAGDNVKPGDTLLIIEAMKVMNPIKAEKAGVVKQILVNDGQPVEFGEALMIIE
ncbi:MAG: acetyl-CoA carboxylase biotin carboxyl carrier protein [Alphaproteobacteria bacterium]